MLEKDDHFERLFHFWRPDPIGLLAAQAQKTSGSFHEALRAVSFVEFRPNPETRLGFPMAQLCHYALERNPANDGPTDPLTERLTLAFSTADIVLLGARLAALLPLLNSHTLEWVATIDSRYAQANAAPWIGKIDVGHFEKTQPPPSGEGNLAPAPSKGEKISGGQQM